MVTVFRIYCSARSDVVGSAAYFAESGRLVVDPFGEEQIAVHDGVRDNEEAAKLLKSIFDTTYVCRYATRDGGWV